MSSIDLFHPTPEHSLLRQTVRDFVREQVEPQALAHDRDERFNLPLFRQLGELGLLGITVASDHGGAGATGDHQHHLQGHGLGRGCFL